MRDEIELQIFRQRQNSFLSPFVPEAINLEMCIQAAVVSTITRTGRRRRQDEELQLNFVRRAGGTGRRKCRQRDLTLQKIVRKERIGQNYFGILTKARHQYNCNVKCREMMMSLTPIKASTIARVNSTPVQIDAR